MAGYEIEPTHEYYTRVRRHFHPGSEKYTGADSLVTLLREGWMIWQNSVTREVVWRGANRPVSLFHFRVVRDDRFMDLHIVDTPYLHRLTLILNLTVNETEEKVAVQAARV